MKSNLIIDGMLDTVRGVWNATQAVVDSIADGSRMQIKVIAEAVSVAVGIEAKQVLGFVNHYLHNIEEDGIGYVTRGKHGGFIKGPRPVKVVKVNASPTPVNTTALDSIINELDEPEETEEAEDIAV